MAAGYIFWVLYGLYDLYQGGAGRCGPILDP
jgi:hypothetical protein